MKFRFSHPEPSTAELTGPRYWKSLDEQADSPEFRQWIEREFPQGASELDGVNRRHFLKIMAASFAAAGVGMAGCRRPEQYIVPFSKQNEYTVPGNPVFYATSLPRGAENIPLVVETHGQRPTKIEGNKDYAPYAGTTDMQAQAEIHNLYDPDRAQFHYAGGGSARLDAARVADRLRTLHDDYAGNGGRGLAFLAEPSSSPTRARLVRQLKEKFPRATWAEYAPADESTAERALGSLLGRPVRPLKDFAKAKRILSFADDFTTGQPASLGQQRGFAHSRRAFETKDAKNMSRLYMVEARLSVTGAMADHRLRLPASSLPAFAALVAAEVLTQAGGDADLARSLRARGEGLSVDGKWITECAADLLAHRGTSLVTAGPEAPESVHQLAYLLNDVLGATGETIRYVEAPAREAASLSELAQGMQAGSFDTLVILGGNPVYNAPGSVDFAGALQNVARVVRLGLYIDETAVEVLSGSRANMHLAGTHFLESWGDGRTYDGTYVPVQPMIRPLFSGLSELEVLAALTGQPTADPYALVQETFSGISGDASRTAFERWLHEGVLPGSAAREAALPRSMPRYNPGALTAPVPTGMESLEVLLLPDACIGDGRFANNGWLQECPDPMTKLTWDNAILISPKLAREIGFDPVTKRLLAISAKKTGEFRKGREWAPLGELTVNGVTLRGPVSILPGLSDYTVLTNLGYGRTRAGRVGDGAGFNAYPALPAEGPAYATGASLSLTGEAYQLANTQEHWSMEGRAIVREANVEDFVEHPDFVDHMGMEAHSPAVYGKKKDKPLDYKVSHQPRGGSLYEHPRFDTNLKNWDTEKEPGGPHQWGMAIDLNACTGCNACVVACQSENNIPIVGKQQVLLGREMHWMRLDRYYSTGDMQKNTQELPDDPQVSLMPMLCQHCENAPCEQVCPVNATVHDSQGLNVMAYNRCVGTRYCANNCPYKVRRFNFFDWNKRDPRELYEGPFGKKNYADNPELYEMGKNPDVTVRMRGVMEKCTFCVQRIQNAKIRQLAKAGDSGDVVVPDGAVQTACQQSCPSEAISFGNLLDTESEVYKWKSSDRDYSVLGYLNVRPRTTYLARLRNPNPKMPDYRTQPLSKVEYDQASGHAAGHGEEHGGHAEPAAHGADSHKAH